MARDGSLVRFRSNRNRDYDDRDDRDSPMASTDIIVGSFVTFTSKRSGDLFAGRVYFSSSASFGIDLVTRKKMFESTRRVEGCYQFSRQDVEDFKVISLPAGPESLLIQKKDNSTITASNVRFYCSINLSGLFGIVINEHTALTFHTPVVYMPLTFHRPILYFPPEIWRKILPSAPKRYYPIIACMGKVLREIVQSQETLKLRRQLGKDSIYIGFDADGTHPWYRLTTNQDGEDIFKEAFYLDTRGHRRSFSVDSKLIFVGGSAMKPPTKVTIFDTRSALLSEPTMPVELSFVNAGLVGSKLYLFGAPTRTRTEAFRMLVVILNTCSGTWDGPFQTSMRPSLITATVDKNIYLFRGANKPKAYYNTSNRSLIETCSSKTYIDEWQPTGGICVMDNTLYRFDTRYGLFWYDANIPSWKKVLGLRPEDITDNELTTQTWALMDYYSKLLLVWTNAKPLFGIPDTDDTMKKIWYSSMTVTRREAEVHGEIDFFKRQLATVPVTFEMSDCLCVSD